MLAPLDIDRGGAPVVPVGVQDLAVPIGPEIGRGAARLIAHPDDLLVGGHREWDPRAMDVVAP